MKIRSLTPGLVIKLLVCLLIVKTTIGILLNYVDYLPPTFGSGFLLGRQGSFWGAYSIAFYTHIASGPVTLLVGMLLLNEPFRRRFPHWHRFFGRIQVITVVFLVAPSGLWMSLSTFGTMAGAGFGTLAVVLGVCASVGWSSAVRQQFVAHRRWMCRCYVLLCSAVVLRIIGGAATVAGTEADWIYPLSAWGSWLVPLILLEVVFLTTGVTPTSIHPRSERGALPPWKQR